MASNAGFATLSIIPSTKGFANALRGQVSGPLARAGGRGGSAMGEATASRFRSIVGPAIAAAGVAAMGAFVTGAVREAANLEQSVGAIDAVFGENAATMHGWARGAAASVGLTRNQYNELGTIIGSQLRNGGVAMDELGGKTDELIRLGGDLSAMFGGTTADAVGAVSAALRGERDTIERYGVSLTQAAVDAKAAELGFARVGGALSQEATQAATIALIMEQTSAAHGAFARETDTVANRMQVLSATWTDSKARIGAAFLPAIAAAAGALTGVLGPATDVAERGIGRMVEAVSVLSAGFTGAKPPEDVSAWALPLIDVGARVREVFEGIRSAVGEVFGSIGAAVGPILPPLLAAFGSLGGAVLDVVTSFSPLGLLFQALAPVLPQLVGLVTMLAGVLANALGSALTILAPVVQSVVGTLSGVFVAILPVVMTLIQALASTFVQLLPPILGIMAAVLPLVATLVGQLAPIFVQLVQAVLPPVLAILDLLVAFLLPVVSTITDLLVPVIAALMPLVVTVFGVIASVVQAAMSIVSAIIQIVTAAISGNWAGVWTGIQNLLAGVWAFIVAAVQGAIAIVQGVIQSVLSTIAAIWSGAWSAIGDRLSQAWDSMTSAVSSAIDGVVGFFRDLPGNILSGLGDLGSLLLSAGEDLIRGFMSGVESMASGLLNAVMAPIEGAVNAVKSFLGIASPSRLFRSIGEFTGEGMAIGLERSASRVMAASSALIPAAPTFRSPDVAGGAFALAAAAGAAPLIGGDLVVPSTGDTRRDVDEVLYRLRTYQRGARP